MVEVDEAIGQLEDLYRAVTGRDLPPSESETLPIPPERDPADYLNEQIERLLSALHPSVGPTARGISTRESWPRSPSSLYVSVSETPSELVVLFPRSSRFAAGIETRDSFARVTDGVLEVHFPRSVKAAASKPG